MVHPLRTVIAADRWKLNIYGQGQGELYDLNTDPHELENLYHRSAHRDRVCELAGRIRTWQQVSGDEAALPDALH